MNIEKIETNRLYLRPFTKDDALFAISIWNDPEMGEYLGDPALETIDPDNADSNGVVKKLGFKVVNTGSYVKRGENKVCPEYTYELLLS
ncbi:GNAT family N-acetyltransferase [Mediterraneibacter gnavus]|uniref:GNAT family N-acetyltransferase n=1 Tax=Mediterraneibacter gnavus TaxID=33038 RepID=UPI00232CAFA9|nr:hypothetical protein [Mediterraneibacter gnavus]MDB8711710.1 hypothetical protein [Mediterraneibacter gnavus]MDB8714723.1 hypothetical protein [Mediterraneibacter gnavus]